MKKIAVVLGVVLGFVMLAVPAQAATCKADNQTWSNTVFMHTTASGKGVNARVQYIRTAKVCGKNVTSGFWQVNYRVIQWQSLLNCKKSGGVKINPGDAFGFNPPAVVLPCSKRGAHKVIAIPKTTLKPYKGDRCAGADANAIEPGKKTPVVNIMRTCHPYYSKENPDD